MIVSESVKDMYRKMLEEDLKEELNSNIPGDISEEKRNSLIYYFNNILSEELYNVPIEESFENDSELYTHYLKHVLAKDESPTNYARRYYEGIGKNIDNVEFYKHMFKYQYKQLADSIVDKEPVAAIDLDDLNLNSEVIVNDWDSFVNDGQDNVFAITSKKFSSTVHTCPYILIHKNTANNTTCIGKALDILLLDSDTEETISLFPMSVSAAHKKYISPFL